MNGGTKLFGLIYWLYLSKFELFVAPAVEEESQDNCHRENLSNLLPRKSLSEAAFTSVGPKPHRRGVALNALVVYMDSFFPYQRIRTRQRQVLGFIQGTLINSKGFLNMFLHYNSVLQPSITPIERPGSQNYQTRIPFL